MSWAGMACPPAKAGWRQHANQTRLAPSRCRSPYQDGRKPPHVGAVRWVPAAVIASSDSFDPQAFPLAANVVYIVHFVLYQSVIQNEHVSPVDTELACITG